MDLSVAWATAGFHGTILLLQVVESLIFTWFMSRRPARSRRSSSGTC